MINRKGKGENPCRYEKMVADLADLAGTLEKCRGEIERACGGCDAQTKRMADIAAGIAESMAAELRKVMDGTYVRDGSAGE